jgi:hypothetical protein
VRRVKKRDRLLHPLNEATGPYYILIEGSESHPECWQGVVYHPELPRVLSAAQDGVIAAFREALADHTLYILRLAELKRSLNDLAQQVSCDYPGQAVVSLSCIYCDCGDAELQINRMVNPDNESHDDAGPRPFHKSLVDQIVAIREKTGKSSFIIADDVCFAGHTARTLLALGLPITHLVGGVVTDSARRTLQSPRVKTSDPQSQSGYRVEGWQKPVKVHSLILVGGDSEGETPFVDTCPIHDFIPFSPLCGKTVGIRDERGVSPLVVGGISFSKPYLLPWLDGEAFNKATSIPADRGLAFSIRLIENAVEVFGNLGDLVGRDLTVGDLAFSNPRLSYPLLKGGSVAVSPSEPITSVLKRDLAILRG